MATTGVAKHRAAVLCLLGRKLPVACIGRVHEVALADEVHERLDQLRASGRESDEEPQQP